MTTTKEIKKQLPDLLESKPQGRPRKYQKKFAEVARAMSFVGANQAEVARFLNVSDRTILNWRRQYLEFDDAMKQGHYANSSVALRLHDCALGYSTTEVKREYAADDDGEMVLRKETITEKEVAPNVSAQLAWLARRDPEHWGQNSAAEEAAGDLVERLIEGRKRARLDHDPLDE